jgi:hypothetical protein
MSLGRCRPHIPFGIDECSGATGIIIKRLGLRPLAKASAQLIKASGSRRTSKP